MSFAPIKLCSFVLKTSASTSGNWMVQTPPDELSQYGYL